MTNDDAAMAILAALQNELASVADASVKFSDAVSDKLQSIEKALKQINATQAKLLQTVAELQTQTAVLRESTRTQRDREAIITSLRSDVAHLRGLLEGKTSQLTSIVDAYGLLPRQWHHANE
jgi:dsDNA-specific endonuclease/ATPase MutS2